MNYEQIKELYEQETNPAIKGIYLNHLKKMEGMKTDCGACSMEEEADVVYELSDDMVEQEEEDE